jgi:molybdenum cofactor biosynthesis protein B
VTDPDSGSSVRAHRHAAPARVPTAVVTVSDSRSEATDSGGALLAARLEAAGHEDVTPDALAPLLEREIPGFGELFRALSYAEIGSAALLSRALAGLVRGRVVIALPGSRAAIRLALEKLVLPELAHLAAEAIKAP